jgi:hypothetical protein
MISQPESPRVTLRVALAALGLLVALAVVGCGGPSPTGPVVLEPEQSGARETEFLAWNVPVTINGETRIALSASRPVLADYEMVDTPLPRQKVLQGMVPAQFKVLPGMLLGPANLVDGVPVAIRVWPTLGMQAGGAFKFPVELDRVTPGEQPKVAIWPVVPLDRRDVDSKPVVVPAGAVLRLGIGVEPACWDALVLPLQIELGVVDPAGRVEALESIKLDLYKKESRRWIDREVPVDAWAGKTVRFRFGARMAGPPSVQYALPVFSMPHLAIRPAAAGN